MRTWTVIAAIAVSLLIPAPTLAAICFQLSPYDDVVVLEIHGEPAGGFFALVGETVGSCGEGTSLPLNGTAHLREDGKAHVGFAVYSATTGCIPFAVQGTLDPPSFDSGTGFVGNASLGSLAVTFVPATCPTLPQ